MCFPVKARPRDSGFDLHTYISNQAQSLHAAPIDRSQVGHCKFSVVEGAFSKSGAEG